MTHNAQMAAFGTLLYSGDTAEHDGDLVFVSGVPTSEWLHGLYVPSPQAASIYIDNGLAIRQDCAIEGIKIEAAARTADTWKFKLFRYNAGTAQYDCIASRDFNPAETGINTIMFSPMVDALQGDIPGIYIPNANYNRLYVGAPASKAPLPRYCSGDVVVGASNAFASEYAQPYHLNMHCIARRPFVVFLGDSIFGGGNGSVADDQWHTDQENAGGVHTPGGNPGDIDLSVPETLSNLLPSLFVYQNFAKGGGTFATTVATQLAYAVAARPTVLHIHCGVNDVAAGRTNAQITANLDTIRAALPSTRLFIDEVLPWQGSDASAVATRSFNAALAIWCAANDAVLVACHDEMATTRTSTGLLDDLNATYSNGDSVHLSYAGVTKLAQICQGYYD